MKALKACINGATTMPYSLERDMETASEAGFQGVEIWKDKLDSFLRIKCREELKDLSSRHGLRVPAICAFGGYVWCREEFRKRIEETRRYFEIANHIGCEALIVCAERIEGKSVREMVEAHAARLAGLRMLVRTMKLELPWSGSET